MKLDLSLIVLYGLALLVGVIFVGMGKLDADAVWGVVVGLLAPAPFARRFQVPATAPLPKWAERLEASLDDPPPAAIDTAPATPAAKRASQPEVKP